MHGPRGDDAPPSILILLDLVDEKAVEEEAGEVRVLLESLLDVAQESRANDAAAPAVSRPMDQCQGLRRIRTRKREDKERRGGKGQNQTTGSNKDEWETESVSSRMNLSNPKPSNLDQISNGLDVEFRINL